MKSLDTLIKLQKTVVDEQRRMLADLQNIHDRIVAEIAALHAAREHEEDVARCADIVEIVTLPQFLGDVKNRLAHLAKAKTEAQVAVEVAHEKLAELFETQKRYEIVRDQRNAAELAEEQKRERLELDEIAEQGHQRKSHAD